jgi:hypothetical protein
MKRLVLFVSVLVVFAVLYAPPAHAQWNPKVDDWNNATNVDYGCDSVDSCFSSGNWWDPNPNGTVWTPDMTGCTAHHCVQCGTSTLGTPSCNPIDVGNGNCRCLFITDRNGNATCKGDKTCTQVP